MAKLGLRPWSVWLHIDYERHFKKGWEAQPATGDNLWPRGLTVGKAGDQRRWRMPQSWWPPRRFVSVLEAQTRAVRGRLSDKWSSLETGGLRGEATWPVTCPGEQVWWVWTCAQCVVCILLQWIVTATLWSSGDCDDIFRWGHQGFLQGWLAPGVIISGRPALQVLVIGVQRRVVPAECWPPPGEQQ